LIITLQLSCQNFSYLFLPELRSEDHQEDNKGYHQLEGKILEGEIQGMHLDRVGGTGEGIEERIGEAGTARMGLPWEVDPQRKVVVGDKEGDMEVDRVEGKDKIDPGMQAGLSTAQR
jgi:hypothetical protein